MRDRLTEHRSRGTLSVAFERKMRGNAGIIDELREKGNKAADDVARLAIRNDSLLEQVFQGVNSSRKKGEHERS